MAYRGFVSGSSNITEPNRAIAPSLMGGKLTGFFVKIVKSRFRMIIDNTEF